MPGLLKSGVCHETDLQKLNELHFYNTGNKYSTVFYLLKQHGIQ